MNTLSRSLLTHTDAEDANPQPSATVTQHPGVADITLGVGDQGFMVGPASAMAPAGKSESEQMRAAQPRYDRQQEARRQYTFGRGGSNT